MAAKLSGLPSGKVFLQMLSCGFEDTAPSLFLFTDSKRLILTYLYFFDFHISQDSQCFGLARC